MPEDKKHPQYVTVKTYAELCEVGVHAIYARIKRSDAGEYKEGDTGYLEQTLLDDAEGVFIDTKAFPPLKRLKKWSKVKSEESDDQ